MYIVIFLIYETVNSHNLETDIHIAHVICYENTFIGQSNCMYHPNYFIIRDLKQRGRERERRQLRKITFLVCSLLLSAGQ